MVPEHLVIRPSAAKRWLNCPGSTWVATATQSDPKVTGPQPGKTRNSPYAAEGTVGHAWLAHFLTEQPVASFLSPGDKWLDLPDDDIADIQRVASLITDMAMIEGYELRVEVSVAAVVDGHRIPGQVDVLLISDDRIVVLDYKHGAGMKVRVKANPQLSLYMVGADQHFNPNKDKEMEIGIIQPRGRGDGFTTWPVTREYLDDFVANCAAALKKSYVVDPAYNEGPWCWGCAGEELGACPAKLMSALAFAVGARDMAAKMTNDKEPGEVTPAWWLVKHAKTAEKLAKKLSGEARAALLEGQKVPGWKIEKQEGDRAWKEQDKIPDVFSELTGLPREEFIKQGKTRVIGIGDATKHPLLKSVNLADYYGRPLKKVMVPDDGSGIDTLFDDMEG